jgi:hypothetical protein
MKVRIKGNSLRFRLNKPDVNDLEKNGIILEAIEFGINKDDIFSFILKKNSKNFFDASFKNNSITILIPGRIMDEWINTGLIGISEMISVKNKKSVYVLIEKDFACLNTNEEENEGTYSNPLAVCEQKEIVE